MIHHTDYPADAPEPAAVPRPLTVRFFGVGDAGCKALEHLARLGFTNAEFIAVNTDSHALHACAIAHKLPIGTRTTHGLGTGGDMQIGHTAAQEGLDRMRHWCKGAGKPTHPGSDVAAATGTVALRFGCGSAALCSSRLCGSSGSSPLAGCSHDFTAL